MKEPAPQRGVFIQASDPLRQESFVTGSTQRISTPPMSGNCAAKSVINGTSTKIASRSTNAVSQPVPLNGIGQSHATQKVSCAAFAKARPGSRQTQSRRQHQASSVSARSKLERKQCVTEEHAQHHAGYEHDVVPEPCNGVADDERDAHLAKAQHVALGRRRRARRRRPNGRRRDERPPRLRRRPVRRFPGIPLRLERLVQLHPARQVVLRQTSRAVLDDDLELVQARHPWKEAGRKQPARKVSRTPLPRRDTRGARAGA